MHHLPFEHQGALEDADLVNATAQMGLDVDRFRRELQEGVSSVRRRTEKDEIGSRGCEK